MPSREEIEHHRTPAGGFTKATLAMWGVSWPPPKGWLDRLVKEHERNPMKPDYQSPLQLNHDEVLKLATNDREFLAIYGNAILDYKNAQAAFEAEKLRLEKTVAGARQRMNPKQPIIDDGRVSERIMALIGKNKAPIASATVQADTVISTKEASADTK